MSRIVDLAAKRINRQFGQRVRAIALEGMGECSVDPAAALKSVHQAIDEYAAEWADKVLH